MLWLVWNMEIWKYDEIRVFQSYQGWFPLTICQGSWKQRIQCFPFSNVFSTYDMNLMWSFAIMWSASMPSNPFFNLFHLCFQGLLDTETSETSETSKPELAHRTGFRSCAALLMWLKMAQRCSCSKWVTEFYSNGSFFLAMSFATFWGDEHP